MDFRSGDARRFLSSFSRSLLRRPVRSLERTLSFESFAASFAVTLLLRDFDLRFARRSLPLLDEVDELELDVLELDELDREPELREDELLSDELNDLDNNEQILF